MGDAFLDAEKIRGSTFLRHVELHEELASTNDRAAELTSNADIELPALVVARRQTAGRGRGQHTWWSADGALTFSMLLDTTAFGITAESWPQLSLTTAVAVCDALAVEIGSSTSRLGIKWPNDVFLDGAKVCGILIESPAAAAAAKRLVIGIGVNVNNSWRSASREAGGNGIAICDATNRTHSIDGVLINALNALQERMRQLAGGVPDLVSAWQSLCWLTEQTVEAQLNGEWIEGVCLGIDHDGTLLVENVFGIHRLRSGSVRAT